jgi:hypothetical protein
MEDARAKRGQPSISSIPLADERCWSFGPRGSSLTFGNKAHTVNVVFIAFGLLLAVVWSVLTIPIIRRFHEEAEKVGFDVYEPRNAVALFRVHSLPHSVQSAARAMRFRSITLLWPGAVMIAIGLFLTTSKKKPNQLPEPTPPSVPIPAGAGLAPAAVVAHL